jgi:hypothetical protein
MHRFVLVLLICMGLAAPAVPAEQRTATRMRNVVFRVGEGVELRVEDLAGHVLTTSAAPPVFDNVSSYLISIDAARVAMTPESLTNLMNNHVFAGEHSPIKNVKIGIEGEELTQSGTLKKGIPVPFSIKAAITATPDGRIRLHPTSIKAAGFVSKRVLDFFGLELENLVKTKHLAGVAVDGDDLLLEPEQLLPPPRIRGHLTRAWIENGLIMQQFGGAIPRTAIAPSGRRTNYMYYRRGTLRFGKLTMRDADLLLVDSDPKDAFDFSPKRYNDQLIAGYSKNTPARGLIVYMPDLGDLPPRRSTPTPAPTPSVETPTPSKTRP